MAARKDDLSVSRRRVLQSAGSVIAAAAFPAGARAQEARAQETAAAAPQSEETRQ